jgi:KaiC/GvpD/RAD55 family RecA-like ATPase
MYRKEVNERSPLRILERSIHGGLGQGNLGVVMSRAGAGSTAFLVQVGLDDLMRDRGVLHISLGQSVDHVLSWYDALFDDLAKAHDLADREEVKARIARRRVIQAFSDHHLTPERLERVVELYSANLEFSAKAILVDDWRWEGSLVRRSAELGAFKAIARRLGAELWMTARTHRHDTGSHPTSVPPPVEAYQEIVDVALFLEPQGPNLTVRLMKDHEHAAIVDTTHLHLDCDTLRLVEDDAAPAADVKLPAKARTLLSGGANGAEEAFGACAEEWGLREQNFSFGGREVARTRGLVELTEAELHQGEVSDAYLRARLHRQFPRTPAFRKILQSIWHQVATAQEVFVVGTIQDDQTVKGGTGWAAELARHMHKPVFIFDQERGTWFTAKDEGWESIDPPSIRRARFAGTGTRHLNDAGRAAIRELFVRSFGTVKAS